MKLTLSQFYWETVLQEVLNKSDPERHFLFTNRELLLPIEGSPHLTATHNPPVLGCTFFVDCAADGLGRVYLTGREVECLTHFVWGQTLKVTAKLLSLSPRTVEFYNKRIKQKLRCSSKSELITKIQAQGFTKASAHRHQKIFPQEIDKDRQLLEIIRG